MTTSFHRRSGTARSGLHPDAELGCGPASAAVAVRSGVQQFIDAHRLHGHRCAKLDPLALSDPMDTLRLTPRRFGLSPDDALTTDGLPLLGAHDVQALDARLKAIYCGSLALDCSSVRDEERCAWLYARMESGAIEAAGGTDLLDRLIQVQAWEQHVARRFPHAKRFSLEGCEALVPLVDALIEQAAAHGMGEIFMGMPHRGRVNVLVNVLGMPPAEVLDHFDPESPQPERHRDLIYHVGGQRVVPTRHGDVLLTLACNPSHLQSVYPVVTGMTHASQVRQTPRQTAGPDTTTAMALVLHGDAAFAGQGVVMETLMLSQKPGYSVGGTVHVIINNQLGFTEPNLMDPQAARYCTDVTRMIDAPILRVNADAPEQVLRAAEIAVAYRAAFGADIVIDLIGYRRLGHSEHDQPAVTSPGVYPMAELKPSVVDVYGAALAADGMATDADMAAYIASSRAAVHEAFEGRMPRPPAPTMHLVQAAPQLSTLSRDSLRAKVWAMTRLPEGFQPHPVVQALIRHWHRLVQDEGGLVDWCFAENVAYASMLEAGIGVRVSGLDVRRGTFLHRHAVWYDQASAQGEFIPLHHLEGAAARFDITNSVLSEEAVLGFEYGYSVQDQRNLTLWEAQFGDFVNGAQVFIDQYISAGEEKWGYRSALTLLLPHGYEGVGPEHSNAYLSRFLQLCGADNMCVASPTTSAQWFHLLRRQAFSEVRKPLVVMTPKATLYNETASHSPVEQLHEGGFQTVLDDPELAAPSDITRVVLCSGKLYYDLQRARQASGNSEVALLRFEQLYPFPQQALARVLERYPCMKTLVWAQEETRNQGAWAFVRDELTALCPAGAALQEVVQPTTASGATSSYAVHRRQQQTLVARALGAAGAPD